MTTNEGSNSTVHVSMSLTAAWQVALGSAAEGLIDFLQSLNDEFDTQPERNHGISASSGQPVAS